MFRNSKYINDGVRFFIVVIGCSRLLFSSSLFGHVMNEEAKIQEISDFKSCAETFTKIIYQHLCVAQKENRKAATEALDKLSRSLDLRETAVDWQTRAWEVYPKFIEAYMQIQGFRPKINEQFATLGFTQGRIDEQLNLNFCQAFQQAKKIPFVQEDADPNYLATEDPNGLIEEGLNRDSTYVMLDDSQLEALQPILQALKDPVTECIRAPWRVLNIRAWKTPPLAQQYGPSAWHTDGLPFALFKIMFYPLGANNEIGTVALQLPEGIHTIEEGPGAWVLFKNSEIVHKGIIPQVEERIAVEIAIVPSIEYDLTPVCAGQNVRHPIVPWKKPYISGHPYYQRGTIKGVNIGGGPKWKCDGWINLEEVTSAANPYSFSLFPNCRFPVVNEGVKCIYTSHAIEHLNIPTVYRVFYESHRILEQGGDLIIKIPDYDKALDCWRRQDPSFFGSDWNLESIIPTWASKNTYDCLDYRAAMIFCSFFNQSFGNPFAPATKVRDPSAYFGPPAVSLSFLRELIKDGSPSTIASKLRQAITTQEKKFRFCHQSAWSREELKTVLGEFGFEVVSFDPRSIIETFNTIPGIAEMESISTFCWARKK